MELSTKQLIDILHQDQHARNHFIGVFPRDRLPIHIPYPSSFIINTHTSKQPGEHWLALYYDKDRNVDFFDSYGHSPKFFNLESYLDKTSTRIKFNSKQLQSFSSKLCGYYCILFILYRSRGFSIEFFVEKFSKNELINDFILLNLIKT